MYSAKVLGRNVRSKWASSPRRTASSGAPELRQVVADLRQRKDLRCDAGSNRRPGMPLTTAVSCDSAMTMPPGSRMARAPSTPSSPMPVRMTPMHCGPSFGRALEERSALGT
jgi:hypothetical protein